MPFPAYPGRQGKASEPSFSASRSSSRKPVSHRGGQRAGAGGAPGSPPAAQARHHHSVYVVELEKAVWLEPRFKRANPGYDLTRPCVYVGMTGLSPDLRFDKHKAGIQANRFVQRYGMRLLPHLYECYNPMPYDAAREMEVELAIGLRQEGYAVWQG